MAFADRIQIRRALAIEARLRESITIAGGCPIHVMSPPCTLHILGVSAYDHDSAAALATDGQIVAATRKERFSRQQHAPRFPQMAIEYCLKAHGFRLADVDQLVCYDKPLVKFDRLIETCLAYTPIRPASLPGRDTGLARGELEPHSGSYRVPSHESSREKM